MEISLINVEAWRYLSIPVVAAVVGWVTNWVAIKLTFWPLEFKGIPPYLGWQGIIPRKVVKMAEITVDKSVSRIGNLEDLIDRIGPDVITDHLINYVDERVEELTDELMMAEFPELWEKAPDVIKQQVYQRSRQELPYTLEEAVFDGIDHLNELVSLKEMIITALVAKPEVLNRMFFESGKEELSFIIRSGFYFGGMFGLMQLLVWYFSPQAWVLPVFGFVVGFATNWMALNIIFRPLHPVKVGPWTVQGMFLKRQKEVATSYSHILASELITPRHLMRTMMEGSRSDAAHELIGAQVDRIMEQVSMPAETLEALMGKGAVEKLKAGLTRQYTERAIEPFEDEKFNRQMEKEIGVMLAEKITGLSSEEFQDILRPAFQEDEWLLIFVGAGLGLLAGFAQLFFIFG